MPQQGIIRPPNPPFSEATNQIWLNLEENLETTFPESFLDPPHADAGPKAGGPRSDQEHGGPMRGRYGAIVPPGAPGSSGIGSNIPKSQQAHASNDYCQHFVDTGQRPQNFLRDTVDTDERWLEG